MAEVPALLIWFSDFAFPACDFWFVGFLLKNYSILCEFLSLLSGRDSMVLPESRTLTEFHPFLGP